MCSDPSGQVSPKDLRELTDVIVKLLSITCEKSRSHGKAPDDTEKANIIPIFMEGQARKGTWETISHTSVPGKSLGDVLS